MELNTNTVTTATLTQAQTSDVQAQSNSALSSDFETFLKMLTTQMENQDPLNPVDSADFAVQLATFSSVEQQVLTNDLLTALTTSMAGGGIGALGQWVGMEVRAGNSAYFDGNEVDLVTPAPGDFDQRILVIRNANGSIATRLNVPLTGNDLIWDGKFADGTVAPNGIYQFSVEGLKTGTLQSSEPVSPYNRVREAVVDGGQTLLVLEGDIVISPEDVSGLRDIN